MRTLDLADDVQLVPLLLALAEIGLTVSTMPNGRNLIHHIPPHLREQRRATVQKQVEQVAQLAEYRGRKLRGERIDGQGSA